MLGVAPNKNTLEKKHRNVVPLPAMLHSCLHMAIIQKVLPLNVLFNKAGNPSVALYVPFAWFSVI